MNKVDKKWADACQEKMAGQMCVSVCHFLFVLFIKMNKSRINI